MSKIAQQEGYVCFDGLHRLKVKSPRYVAIHHVKGNEVSLRKLLAVAVLGESDEWVAYFPEYQVVLGELRAGLNRLVAELERAHESIMERFGGNPTDKEYALEAKQTVLPAALFSLRRRKIPIRAFIRGMRLEHLENLLVRGS